MDALARPPAAPAVRVSARGRAGGVAPKLAAAGPGLTPHHAALACARWGSCRSLSGPGFCKIDSTNAHSVGALRPQGRNAGFFTRALSADGAVTEDQGVAELKERLSDTKATERDIKWFLRDRRYDVDAADTKIRKMLEWRKDFGADELTEEVVAEEFATGKAYLHDARDKFGRPVIIVSTSKHLSGDEVSLKKACELATFTIDKAVGQLEAEDSKEWDVDDKGKPVPFKSQTVLCIFDLRGFQNKNGDFGFAKFMVNVFFDLYPKRLSECIFLDSPLMFKPGWAIIKPWLGSYSRLVRFVKSKDVCSEYFTPDTCPDHMK